MTGKIWSRKPRSPFLFTIFLTEYFFYWILMIFIDSLICDSHWLDDLKKVQKWSATSTLNFNPGGGGCRAREYHLFLSSKDTKWIWDSKKIPTTQQFHVIREIKNLEEIVIFPWNRIWSCLDFLRQVSYTD